MCVLNRNTRATATASQLLGALFLGLAAAPAIVGCQTTGDDFSSAGAEDPRAELLAQIDAGDALFDERGFDDARQRYQAVFLAANARGYVREATEAAAMTSVSLSMLNQVDDGQKWLARAEDKADQSDHRSWSRMLLARGVQRWKNQEELTARRTFIELYNYCFLNSLTPRAIQAATLASLTSQGQEQLDWSMRAIQAAQTTGNIKWQAPLWSSHAWLLDSRGRSEEALDAFRRARDLTGRVDISRLGRLQTDWAYGHGLRMVGKLKEARDLLEQTNAIAHSIYIAKPSPRAAEYFGRIQWEIGEIDATEGNKRRARERFMTARTKMLEAGAAEGAPELVTRLDQRLEELDAPPAERRYPKFPLKNKPKR